MLQIDNNMLKKLSVRYSYRNIVIQARMSINLILVWSIAWRQTDTKRIKDVLWMTKFAILHYSAG